MEVPRDVKQVMAFSWNGLADNVALLIRDDSTDIKAVLTEKPEWLQKAIRKELTEREGVVPSCNHMGKVETNGNVFIQDFFENRAGDFAHGINRIKKFFLNAIAEKYLKSTTDSVTSLRWAMRIFVWLVGLRRTPAVIQGEL